MTSPYLEQPLRSEAEVRAMTDQPAARPTPEPWKAGVFEASHNGVPIYSVKNGGIVAVAKYFGGTAVAHQNAKLFAGAKATAAERDRLVKEHKITEAVIEAGIVKIDELIAERDQLVKANAKLVDSLLDMTNFVQRWIAYMDNDDIVQFDEARALIKAEAKS